MISSNDVFLPKLNSLIDANVDDPDFSVDTICRELGVSRSHLHRTIKEKSDLSTSLYIRKRRLLKASYLLLTTDLRISEIGDSVGIANPQNFSTYFIDEFKVSPTEFRKLHAQASINGAATISPPDSGQDAAPLPVADQPAGRRSRHPAFGYRRKWIGAGVAAGLLLMISVGGYLWFRGRPVGRSTQSIGSSLAVLPFTNLGAADSSPACEGIMDDIHRSVSRIKNLKVIARSSSDRYGSTKKSIWQTGDELQVTNVLKGSVLKTDDQIQVKVEIIGTQDDVLLWGHTYRAAYADIFTLTDQIVQDIARQLKLTNADSPTEQLAQVRTRNLEAYNLFLQGRQLLVSRLEADSWAGLHRFDQALALDSTFAEAYALKAVAYHLLIGTAKMTPQTVNRLTEENALKAIRLEPANSTAYAVLGSLYFVTYQWQASENAFLIAMQQNPNNAQANYWYSLLLRTTGRVNEAVAYSAKAVTLDPLHPIILAGHIVNCNYAGRTGEAQTAIKTGQALFDKSFAFQMAIANYWLLKADYGRAAVYFQQMLALNPTDRSNVPVLLYCEAKRGNRASAIQFLKPVKTTTPRSDYERAVVYAGLDQADSSLYYLKKAADGGYIYRDMKVIPVFKPYWAHPVFSAILRQYHLSDRQDPVGAVYHRW